jgi:asparagine synthase (glutamine-hydrolysing)
MSGIVGIVRSDDAPVDRQLVWQLTEAMAYRGPDAQEIHVDGSVGLGHALMNTGGDSQEWRQPFTLDGRVWITADARIDARAELMADLGIQDSQARQTLRDEELILRAYASWGEDCVRHLIGDFAFAIWDTTEKRLLCARDRFGVKPFFYAQVPGGLIFSNTFQAVRLHPEVSGELNEQTIGDFLLFGSNLEASTTGLAQIRRLPPAHQLVWSGDTPVLSQYWRFRPPPELKYARPEDYVAHFSQLLRSAVADRLRTNRVAVFMSGGLDSTTVAATARQVLAARHVSFDLRAFTAVCERLIPCQEGKYAGHVADALGVGIHYLNADNYHPYQPCDVPVAVQPDPVHSPFAASGLAQSRLAAAHCRVGLTGLGPDVLFSYPMRHHVAALLRNRRICRATADLSRYVRAHRPFAFRAVLAGARRLIERGSNWEARYPTWLDEAFAARLELQQRWTEANRGPLAPGNRGQTYDRLAGPLWAATFESWDAGCTGIPLDVYHPFFDIRLVEFCAALPPVPWCINKHLLRTVTRGVLPDQVRLRPKAPLAGDPLLEAIRTETGRRFLMLNAVPALRRYVDTRRLEPVTGKERSAELWMKLRPQSLQHWLEQTSVC